MTCGLWIMILVGKITKIGENKCKFVTVKSVVKVLALVLPFCMGCGSGKVEQDVAETGSCSRRFHPLDSMPGDGCVKLRISPRVGALGRQFNDKQPEQLAAARAVGIDPIREPRDAWNLRRPVELIESCEDFYVDSLTHSYPYLVPEAADLLHTLGARFRDTLEARGGGDYRIKVTSVLRTAESVRRLRRRNVNAVDTSTHQFGTTFDVSYVRFVCDSANEVPRTQGDLKNLLAEILLELRDSARCLVKYERKQGCFHITVTPPPTLTDR